ncbi:MAG: Rne/Rng family ribonuclease [Desulfobacterales bacterium CG23_combo_of_CG06-09_8_20_14_all_51_8]|nr:MAG: Rne/Rng family ribonuclease [Desulfobacterales bacterium CG23_combo_of_CG06-09_8_20_14_all_51_8]
MYRELVVNAIGPEIRVALLEDGTIVELYVERSDESNLSGNIYKGRVQRVLPGMQAAFVDIGLNQAAFIYVDDVIDERESGYLEHVYLSNKEEEDDAGLQSEEPDGEKEPPKPRSKSSIETLLAEGQDVLVQIARSPIGSKGARLTSYVSIPGRFLVLMPTVDHIGISKRITDEDERLRLKNLVLALRTQNHGYIVRTAGEGLSEDKMRKEMDFLANLWTDVQASFRTAVSPALLHKELTVTLRSVRDLLTHDADKVTIDSAAVHKSVLMFIEKFMPHLTESITLYEGPEPIFDAYNLEVDIGRALKKKVWLKCGGYIIIENTEALVVIDVNTGRYVGKHNFEETVLKTNLEAVKEIAYQVRLRNLGGIIIIDFIDMERKSNQEKVYTSLVEALKKDKAKTNVLPISDMGLVQMTRKRVVKSLNRMLCEPCFYCDGEGVLLSRQTICNNIYREVLRLSHDVQGEKISLRVHPDIADLLLGEANDIIISLEKHLHRQVVIYPVAEFHIEEFNIIELYLE